MPGRSTPAGSAQSPVNRLIEVLSLGEPAASLQHTYIKGESLYFPTGHVYGGQVIAQSVVAASETVPEGRLPQSIHGYFIAAGDIHQDVLFDVENLRDGKSFSSRRVNATQRDGAIFTAITSFQEYGQDGFQFHDPAPDVAVQPEDHRSISGMLHRQSCSETVITAAITAITAITAGKAKKTVKSGAKAAARTARQAAHIQRAGISLYG